MSDLINLLRDNFEQFDATSAIDIIIISLILFWLLMLLRGTTAMAVMRGAFILLIAAFVLARDLRPARAELPDSQLVHGPPDRAADHLPAGAAAGAGARGAHGRAGVRRERQQRGHAGGDHGRRRSDMAKRHIGALMVIERETGLQDYIETGIPVDAIPSPELIEGIFFPNSPLHDGAVVLRGNRVVAAGVTLPLSENTLPGELGTRHRAGLGITERTDAVSVIVSEETGRISVAAEGRMHTRLDEAAAARAAGPPAGGARQRGARHELDRAPAGRALRSSCAARSRR